jgi:hypothetical protein
MSQFKSRIKLIFGPESATDQADSLSSLPLFREPIREADGYRRTPAPCRMQQDLRRHRSNSGGLVCCSCWGSAAVHLPQQPGSPSVPLRLRRAQHQTCLEICWGMRLNLLHQRKLVLICWVGSLRLSATVKSDFAEKACEFLIGVVRNVRCSSVFRHPACAHRSDRATALQGIFLHLKAEQRPPLQRVGFHKTLCLAAWMWVDEEAQHQLFQPLLRRDLFLKPLTLEPRRQVGLSRMATLQASKEAFRVSLQVPHRVGTLVHNLPPWMEVSSPDCLSQVCPQALLLFWFTPAPCNPVHSVLSTFSSFPSLLIAQPGC